MFVGSLCAMTRGGCAIDANCIIYMILTLRTRRRVITYINWSVVSIGCQTMIELEIDLGFELIEQIEHSDN